MCSTEASVTQNNMVFSDNSQYNDSLVCRISQLRQVLRDLRLALHLERSNLKREIQLTCKDFSREQDDWCQEEINSNTKKIWQSRDHSRYKFEEIEGSGECYQLSPYLDTEKWNSTSELDFLKEKQVTLESFEQNVLWTSSTLTSNYYKQKIFDLENDCNVGLNKIRLKFMESWQVFEKTLDQAEFCCDQKELHIMGSENKLDIASLQTPQENYKADRNSSTYLHEPLTRSKSLIISNIQNKWPRNICSGRYSDSDICGLVYRSSQQYHEPTQIFDSTDCISDFTNIVL